MPAAIVCDHLTKRYGASRGIEDLTLCVAPGEIFGFLGPNGAGKTTTIRTLLDLQRPTSGRATVLGLESHRDSRAIRRRVGNLPGNFSLDPTLTGRRAVALFAAVRGVRDVTPAHELAERFEADLDRPFGQLSRGNRQKIGLVLALFSGPELLVLDEPTSGLDPLMQSEFLTVLGEHRARGGTVFLSSHELGEVQRVCDRVGIVRDGRLVATDRVDLMRDRASRRAVVRFGGETDPAPFRALVGVGEVTVDGTCLRFSVRGDVGPLIAELARHDVRDLEIAQPTLDELFLDYYRGENRA